MGKEKSTKDQKQIRLWPGVAIVLFQLLTIFGLKIFAPGSLLATYGVMGGALGGVVILVWWAFFSRAPRPERWGGAGLMIVALIITSQFLHKSIATGGQGMLFFIYAIPFLTAAFVVWSLISHRLSKTPRRVLMIMTILLASGIWTLVRSDGITGDFYPILKWRWIETHEEQLLSKTKDQPLELPQSAMMESIEANWPGFRGPDRDAAIHGIQIETNWEKSPPVELWRRPIGPGCSSFAAKGSLLYTQEQRGENETVSCYNLANGKLVWQHKDPIRFWDSHAGAGPRSTPTIKDNRIYTLGATGILNVLNAQDGSIIWSRNAASDTKVQILEWGFTSSPLVVDDKVMVALSGKLAAYDFTTGELRWYGPDGGHSYSSPHLVNINGVPQIIMMSKAGATSFNPAGGTILWEYNWGKSRIVQPALTTDGDLLLSSGEGSGLRRITVTKEGDEWTVKEKWSSKKLRPNFNDFVIHQGFAFGFNGPNIVCIDLKDGRKKWKSGRYGGQLLLLSDQDLLLVLSEKGEVALVKAASDKFSELARFPAIKGKTWNHPIMVNNILVVRNTREIAAFRLPAKEG